MKPAQPNPVYRHNRVLLVLLILLAATWGVWGWLDLPHRTAAGFSTDGSGVVTEVRPGSPAESAGLLPGDAILKFDGIAATNQTRLARQPVKRAGESSLLDIQRSGEPMQLRVPFQPLSEHVLRIGMVSLLVGLVFLLVPAIVHWRHPNEATRALVVMGAGLSFAFFDSPSISATELRAASLAITTWFVLTGVAALVQFLLTFPLRRAWLARPMRRRLLYLPVWVLWCLLAWRVLFTPTSTSTLSGFTQFLAAIVMGGYLLCSLYLLLRNFSRTDKSQRRALALNWMLLGTLIGFVPGTIDQLIRAFSRHAHLPGQDFYFLSLALIPLTWAWSASRYSRSTGTASPVAREGS